VQPFGPRDRFRNFFYVSRFRNVCPDTASARETARRSPAELVERVAAAASRTVCAFLKATTPVKLTSEPSATIRCIAAASLVKQWKTPRTRSAKGVSSASVSSSESRWWMTQFNPVTAATSRCWRNSSACFAFEAGIVFRRGAGLLAGQMMVVQPRSPRATTFGCRARSRSAGRKSSGACKASEGVPAHGGEDVGKLFGQLYSALAAPEVRGDGDDFDDAGRFGAAMI